MEDVLKDIDEHLKARKEEPLPTIPYELFRELAKWALFSIEEKLDESPNLPVGMWLEYQRVAKQIREAMEEGGRAALLEYEGTPEYDQAYLLWAEVRDKANELDYDIGEVIRKLKEATDQEDE